MLKMLKDAVNNLKFLYIVSPFSPFVKELILMLISLIPLLVFYGVIGGLLLFFYTGKAPSRLFVVLTVVTV